MFLFGLAEKMGLPLRILLQIMDSKEITEWIAYYKALQEPEKKPEVPPKIVESQLMSWGKRHKDFQGKGLK